MWDIGRWMGSRCLSCRCARLRDRSLAAVWHRLHVKARRLCPGVADAYPGAWPRRRSDVELQESQPDPLCCLERLAHDQYLADEETQARIG